MEKNNRIRGYFARKETYYLYSLKKKKGVGIHEISKRSAEYSI